MVESRATAIGWQEVCFVAQHDRAPELAPRRATTNTRTCAGATGAKAHMAAQRAAPVEIVARASDA
jgi:hypothetical protein